MIAIASALLVLALIDGACSGFRANVGRTGLVRHRAADIHSALRGLRLAALLLMPTAALSLMTLGGRESRFEAAGSWMLRILVPYAVVVGLALLAYGLLPWRQKYLAMALVLGPFTLARPFVATAAGLAGCVAARDWLTDVAVVLAVSAQLAVEGLMNRRLKHVTVI